MINFKYSAISLTKYFIRKHFIFKDMTLAFSNGDIIAITGSNGSGKSTLLKVMTGVLSYSSGKIELIRNGENISLDNFRDDIALVSPYLNLYEEFTPLEHYKVSAELRGIPLDLEFFEQQLKKFRLQAHKNSPIKNFSSGMKQRMKFILALQNNPTVLFLDEPTSNLDTEGIESVNNIIKEHSAAGGAVVIATNEEREKALCNACYEVKAT